MTVAIDVITLLNSSKMIDRSNGRYDKPVGWRLFCEYYEFPDVKDFKKQFPKYNYWAMDNFNDHMTTTSRNFKTKRK